MFHLNVQDINDDV